MMSLTQLSGIRETITTALLFPVDPPSRPYPEPPPVVARNPDGWRPNCGPGLCFLMTLTLVMMAAACFDTPRRDGGPLTG